MRDASQRNQLPTYFLMLEVVMADAEKPPEVHEPTAAVRMSRNDWPDDLIAERLHMRCHDVRAQLANADKDRGNYDDAHTVRTRWR